MHTVKASEFEANCLKFMDLVNEMNEGIVITKDGKPISKLLPYKQNSLSLFGFSRGQLESFDDLIEGAGEEWDAEK